MQLHPPSLRISLSLFLSATVLLSQGPLSPPPGAPAPTMKSLDQIEPRIAINAANTPGDAGSLFRITQSGSYYLTGNLTGAAAKNGIAIAAGGVTVDLNGFSLIGVMGSLNGIEVAGVRRRIKIHHGDIAGWDGVAVNGANGIISQLEDLRVSNNDGGGLVIGGASTIRNCVAQDNGASGLRAGAGSTVIGCSSSSNVTGITATDAKVQSCAVNLNTGDGIVLSGAATVGDCTVVNNGNSGIVAGSGAHITHTTSSNNGARGIEVISGAIIGCTVYSNTGDGILTGSGATVKDCVAEGNARGLVTDDGANIAGCSAKSNLGDGIVTRKGSAVVACSASQNGGHGISGRDGCTVHDSAATANGGTGIIMNNAFSTVARCTARGNAQHGIIAESVSGCGACGNTLNGIQVSAGNSYGFVFENTCNSNGGAGIFVGAGNRVEGNTVIDNARGIEVTGGQNLIIRNSARSNGFKNYVIASGNRRAPIVDITAQIGPAVSGSNAPDNLGVTHPWANFSY